MARLARITALRWVRPQTVTSMRRPTGTPTKTPEAVGRAQVRTLRNTTQQATPRPPRRVVQLPVAGDSRKRAADRQPSIAEAGVGNPGRQVLAARQAAAAGEVAGEPSGAMARANKFAERW